MWKPNYEKNVIKQKKRMILENINVVVIKINNIYVKNIKKNTNKNIRKNKKMKNIKIIKNTI